MNDVQGQKEITREKICIMYGNMNVRIVEHCIKYIKNRYNQREIDECINEKKHHKLLVNKSDVLESKLCA